MNATLEELKAVKEHRDNLMCALHDVLNVRVTWGKWVREHDGAGRYRAGLSRDRLLLITFRHPGQQDSTSVHEAAKEIDNILRLRAGSPTWEPVLQAIRNAQMQCGKVPSL